MNKQDGGPAFPTSTRVGMSLRAYFAARAPAEIPRWFEPKIDMPFPQRPKWENLRQDLQRAARDWINDPSYDFGEDDPPELVAFQQQFETFHGKADAWRLENEIARYFRWRWHYADKMLESQ